MGARYVSTKTMILINRQRNHQKYVKNQYACKQKHFKEENTKHTFLILLIMNKLQKNSSKYKNPIIKEISKKI